MLNFRLTLKRLRRARAAGLAALVAFTLLWIGTVGREFGVHFGGGTLVCIGNGCFQIGANTERFDGIDSHPARDETGPYFMRNWHDDWMVAWRPFHVYDWTVNRSGRSTPNLLVFPLWPLMPLLGLGVGCAHGVLVGTRRARTDDCRACGYDLSKCPTIADGSRICPECGRTAAVVA